MNAPMDNYRACDSPFGEHRLPAFSFRQLAEKFFADEHCADAWLPALPGTLPSTRIASRPLNIQNVHGMGYQVR
jgi:hypothetical protein